MLGPLIDVPLMSGVFALIAVYCKRLVRLILKIPLPRLVLAILCAVPLIVFEEHINCGAYGCTNVILPPTLLFLLIEEFLFFMIVKACRTTKVILPTILYGVFGMFFEFIIGVDRAGLHQLAAGNLLLFALLMIWVGFSYVFVMFLPLAILNAPSNI